MEKLLNEAKKVSERAYAPYSNFKVGAAVETKEGKVFAGCNIENASYSMTMCAERTAIFKAVSEGYTKFKRIGIYCNSEKMFVPCGACLQVMLEFCDADTNIFVENNKGERLTYTLKELIPHGFKLK